MALVLSGWAAFLLNLVSFSLVLVLVMYIVRFQIILEESALFILFGNTYTTYKSRVRRWLYSNMSTVHRRLGYIFFDILPI